MPKVTEPTGRRATDKAHVVGGCRVGRWAPYIMLLCTPEADKHVDTQQIPGGEDEYAYVADSGGKLNKNVIFCEKIKDLYLSNVWLSSSFLSLSL